VLTVVLMYAIVIHALNDRRRIPMLRKTLGLSHESQLIAIIRCVNALHSTNLIYQRPPIFSPRSCFLVIFEIQLIDFAQRLALCLMRDGPVQPLAVLGAVSCAVAAGTSEKALSRLKTSEAKMAAHGCNRQTRYADHRAADNLLAFFTFGGHVGINKRERMYIDGDAHLPRTRQ
jgi:hypothetical protein